MTKQKPKYTNGSGVELEALLIGDIELSDDGSALIIPEPRDIYPRFRVDSDYVKKFNPKKGDYYVILLDGGESYMKKESFESNYKVVK